MMGDVTGDLAAPITVAPSHARLWVLHAGAHVAAAGGSSRLRSMWTPGRESLTELADLQNMRMVSVGYASMRHSRTAGWALRTEASAHGFPAERLLPVPRTHTSLRGRAEQARAPMCVVQGV